MYAEKNARKVNREPAIVYAQSRAFLMATRSAMTPNTGLVKATIAVEIAIPRLHNELPVKVNPRNIASSPRAFLKRNTK